MLKVLKNMANETDRRREICRACPDNVEKKIPMTEVSYKACRLCGCVIKNMTAIPGLHCKAKKW